MQFSWEPPLVTRVQFQLLWSMHFAFFPESAARYSLTACGSGERCKAPLLQSEGESYLGDTHIHIYILHKHTHICTHVYTHKIK